MNLKVGQSSKIIGIVKYHTNQDGEGILIQEQVIIRGPVELSDGVVINDNAYIGPNTIINSGCIIGPHAVIGDTSEKTEKPVMTVLEENCIIGANVTVRAGTYLVEGTKIL